MKRMLTVLTCLAALGAASLVLAKPAARPDGVRSNPWAEISRKDLDEIHRLLVTNHPGQVDPRSSVFRAWNQRGYALASQRAKQARNFYDYKRVIQVFLNGFDDDHVEARMDVDALNKAWPGFIVTADGPQQVRVALSDTKDIPAGAALLACDGVAAPTLLQQRVLTYYWNPKLPRELPYVSTRLTVVDSGDASARLKSCAFEVGGKRIEIALGWRIVSTNQALALQQRAVGWVHPEMDVTNRDGVWFVSPNTLRINTAQDIATFRAFLAKIDAHRDDLRRGPLVLDLRGVPGGVSSWGDEVVSHIYGPDWVAYANAQDSATDWRVSPDNIKRNADVANEKEANGIVDEAKFYNDLTRRMREAFAKGEPFVRTGDHTPSLARPARNPVAGHVYLLTDGICKSACLDVVDLARKLPDMCHIGRPTGADTLYMENTFRDLPSGFGRFTYSQKVDRERPRGANAWYDPSILWSDGPMTDEAIAHWVSQLEQQRRANPEMCRLKPAATAP